MHESAKNMANLLLDAGADKEVRRLDEAGSTEAAGMARHECAYSVVLVSTPSTPLNVISTRRDAPKVQN